MRSARLFLALVLAVSLPLHAIAQTAPGFVHPFAKQQMVAAANPLAADAGLEIQKPQHVETVDMLHVDLYDHEAAAPVLDSQAFYDNCYQLLAENGVMTVNLFGRNASYEKSLSKIAEAFGPQAVWAFSPTKEGNTVVLAQREPTRPERDDLLLKASDIESRWGVPAKKWLRLFKPVM